MRYVWCVWMLVLACGDVLIVCQALKHQRKDLVTTNIDEAVVEAGENYLEEVNENRAKFRKRSRRCVRRLKYRVVVLSFRSQCRLAQVRVTKEELEVLGRKGPL